MENLSERFNALQDQLMNIYETAKNTLEAQIEHWMLLRREAAMLYVARQKGFLRLGYQPVPPQAVSETKAKEAIMMMLQLQSLQQSKYKDEPWTLVDTSLETYKNQPENTFKKRPLNVEVMYDNDPTNTNLYTMWRDVYYLDADDQWQKTESGVNHIGIYYKQGTFKNYYILFADDAPRFSSKGEWEVIVNKDTVFAPVTSSTPPESPGSRQQTSGQSTGDTATADSETNRSTTRQQQTQKRKGFGRKDSSPTTTSAAQKRNREESERRRSRSRSVRPQKRSRIRSRSRSTSSRGSRGSHRRKRKRSTQRGRGGRSRSTSRGRTLRRRASRGSSSSSSPERRTRATERARGKSPYSRGVSPSDVGATVQTVSGRHKGRLGRLLAEAHDPPVILVKGDPNVLRGFRNRTKGRYRDLFKSCSTTWSWVANDGCERLGRSRMLFSFASYDQRQKFDKSVKFPKSVEKTYGHLDSL